MSTESSKELLHNVKVKELRVGERESKVERGRERERGGERERVEREGLNRALLTACGWWHTLIAVPTSPACPAQTLPWSVAVASH